MSVFCPYKKLFVLIALLLSFFLMQLPVFAAPSLDYIGEYSTGVTTSLAMPASGDINGDGYIDFAMNQFNYNSNNGRHLFFFGGLNPDLTPDLTILGENIELGGLYQFGNNSFGHINSDSTLDMFLSGSFNSLNASSAGIEHTSQKWNLNKTSCNI
jgi:hypothetical protein